MSRIAKAPVDILSGVEISIAGQEVTVKGKNGTLVRVFNDAVEVVQEENQLVAKPREGEANGWAQSGTARSLLNNMILGVSQGFEKKTTLKWCWLPCASSRCKTKFNTRILSPSSIRNA